MKNLTFEKITIALTLLPVIALPAQPAIAQVPPSGTFTATQACAATRAINGVNPGNIQLTINQSYAAIGFNSPRREQILIRVPGATPQNRWVKATCGTFTDTAFSSTNSSSSSSGSGTSSAGATTTNLMPFFDNQSNPIPVDFPRGQRKDITPPPPTLNQFDQEMVKLCGPGFSAAIDRNQFRRVVAAYPTVVANIKQAAGGALRPNRTSDQQFLDDLTAAWFDSDGFKHVFCGEISGSSSGGRPATLGGLHFVGRYWDLQQKQLGGMILQTSTGRAATEEVVDGVIYTMGAQIRQGNRIIAESPIKGYPYVSNAEEILVATARVFPRFNPAGATSAACRFTVTDQQAGKSYQAVFVKRAGAIRTFYPDATPDNQTPQC